MALPALTLKTGKQKKQPFEFGEEDEESLLQTIGSASLSGLARVANVLDLPGSSVRDLLAGQNPVDQWLPWRWTTDEGRVTGRDLLRQYGAAGSQDSWGNFGAGLAVDVLADPLTYLSLGTGAVAKGALTSGGKVLQAAGKLDDVAKVAGKSGAVANMTTKVKDVVAKGGASSRKAAENAAKKMGVNLDDVGEEVVGSLARWEVPFTKIGGAIGTADSPVAMKVAQGLDYASEVVGQSPLGTFASGLFDPVVRGTFNKGGQALLRAAKPQVDAAAREAATHLAHHIDPIRETNREFRDLYLPYLHVMHPDAPERTVEQLADRVFEDLVSLVAETGKDFDGAMKDLSLPIGQVPAALRKKIVGLGESMQKVEDSIHKIGVMMGRKEGTVENVAASGTDAAYTFLSRNRNSRPQTLGGVVQNLTTRTNSSLGRDEVVQTIPKAIVNRMLTDDGIRNGAARDGQKLEEYIVDKWGRHLGKGLKQDQFGNWAPKWTKEEHAAQVATWVQEHEQFPLFNQSTLGDFYHYVRDGLLKNANTETIHEFIKDELLPSDHPTGIKVADLFGSVEVGMVPEEAGAWLAAKVGKTADEVLEMRIPEDVANTIISVRKAQDDPEWLGAIGGAVDYVSDIVRRNVLIPFPSSWTRNLTGGQYMNGVSGFLRTLDDVAKYKNSALAAERAWKTADSDFLKTLLIHDVIDPRVLFEGVETRLPEFGYAGNPADVRKTFGEVSGEVADNPLFKSAGLNAVADPFRKGYGTLMRTGEKAMGLIEYMNRAPMFLYLTQELGWAPEAAAAKVKELQVDYKAVTPFERNVMKRAMLFYTWQRRMAPTILKTLAERPGGGLAQTIRASREASGSDATTPDWVASTLSIPNPFKTPEPGGASYITGFGLPFENLAGFAESPRGAGREFLSQLNPLVKAPLEYFTNQSFFQTGPGGAGRPLDDLDPTLGRTIANLREQATGEKQRDADYLPRGLEFAVANSPLSRFASTARQLTDPRKTFVDTAVNMLTGARVTDISPAAQDAVLRERAMNLMRGMGSRTFAKTYFPDETVEGMSPGERALAEQLEALQALLADRAKQRKLSR